MKWNIGVKFQIIALQAVMVDLSSRETIHHAFNIPVFGKYVSKLVGDKNDMKTMKAIL